jgi:hypothetical protein
MFADAKFHAGARHGACRAVESDLWRIAHLSGLQLLNSKPVQHRLCIAHKTPQPLTDSP